MILFHKLPLRDPRIELFELRAKCLEGGAAWDDLEDGEEDVKAVVGVGRECIEYRGENLKNQ